MKVLLESPILTQSGYGEHSRLVFESIKDLGLEIHLLPVGWGNTPWSIGSTEVHTKEIEEGIRRFELYNNHCKQTNQAPQFDAHIHVGILNEFKKKANYSVCVTAGIETDRVSPEWLIKTHQEGPDKIIVPSEHAKLGFEQTSFEILVKNQQNQNEKQLLELNKNCPIEVVPYPIKEIETSNIDIELETDFNFLTVSLLGPRKNIEESLIWFLEEFGEEENVGLVLKTAQARASIMDRLNTAEHLNNIIQNFPNSKCKIYLLHGNLSDSEINSLYNHPKIKAYITATHGEGYGLPIFEAAYNGLPVIATNWSGHLDFLTGQIKENNKIKEKKLFAKIEYDLKEIPKSVVWENILIEGSKWAFPKPSSFKSQARKVYKNYGMYKKWASILQNKLQKTHSKEVILKKMSDALIPEDQREWLTALNEIEIL